MAWVRSAALTRFARLPCTSSYIGSGGGVENPFYIYLSIQTISNPGSVRESGECEIKWDYQASPATQSARATLRYVHGSKGGWQSAAASAAFARTAFHDNCS
jgi:hypothetical protein